MLFRSGARALYDLRVSLLEGYRTSEAANLQTQLDSLKDFQAQQQAIIAAGNRQLQEQLDNRYSLLTGEMNKAFGEEQANALRNELERASPQVAKTLQEGLGRLVEQAKNGTLRQGAGMLAATEFPTPQDFLNSDFGRAAASLGIKDEVPQPRAEALALAVTEAVRAARAATPAGELDVGKIVEEVQRQMVAKPAETKSIEDIAQFVALTERLNQQGTSLDPAYMQKNLQLVEQYIALQRERFDIASKLKDLENKSDAQLVTVLQGVQAATQSYLQSLKEQVEIKQRAYADAPEAQRLARLRELSEAEKLLFSETKRVNGELLTNVDLQKKQEQIAERLKQAYKDLAEKEKALAETAPNAPGRPQLENDIKNLRAYITEQEKLGDALRKTATAAGEVDRALDASVPTREQLNRMRERLEIEIGRAHV